MEINFNRHIWEGWTVRDMIDELEGNIDLIMKNQSYIKPFKSKDELKKFCMNNQPYYKKHIPEVVNYFSKQYKIN